MIDMDAVGREIEAGRAELAASDKAILTLATRKRIWRAMLDPQDDEASYRRFIELDMRCVRHVQGFWDRAFPGDSRVEEMLTLAQELINQQADEHQAERRARIFVTNVFDEVDDYNAITQPAVFVADGASHMVTSACHRDPIYYVSGEADDDELWPELNKMAFWGNCCGIPGWRLRSTSYKIISCRST